MALTAGRPEVAACTMLVHISEVNNSQHVKAV